MAAAFQAFYGLAVFSSILSVGWYTAAHKGWSTPSAMADLRLFTLTVMSGTSVLGLLASVRVRINDGLGSQQSLGLAALLPPMLDEDLRRIVDVAVGSGELMTIAMTAAMGYLTLAFSNLSHAALKEMSL